MQRKYLTTYPTFRRFGSPNKAANEVMGMMNGHIRETTED